MSCAMAPTSTRSGRRWLHPEACASRQLKRHLSEGATTPKAAESLRRRLIWFESFLFGRVANLSLHVRGKRATSNSASTALDGEVRRALEFFRDRVVNGPPIEISSATGEVLFVFSDGAFEESWNGWWSALLWIWSADGIL